MNGNNTSTSYGQALGAAMDGMDSLPDEYKSLFADAFRKGWRAKENSLSHDEELIVYKIARAAQDYAAACVHAACAHVGDTKSKEATARAHQSFVAMTEVARDHLHAANKWKDRIIDMLVIDGTLQQEHFVNPEKALHELVSWSAEIALDPAVSSKAAALQFRQSEDPAFSLVVNGEQFNFLLQRSLRTLEPVKTPAWAYPLSDTLLPSDHVHIEVKRAVPPSSSSPVEAGADQLGHHQPL